jgi:hypothetical protein
MYANPPASSLRTLATATSKRFDCEGVVWHMVKCGPPQVAEFPLLPEQGRDYRTAAPVGQQPVVDLQCSLLAVTIGPSASGQAFISSSSSSHRAPGLPTGDGARPPTTTPYCMMTMRSADRHVRRPAYAKIAYPKRTRQVFDTEAHFCMGAIEWAAIAHQISALHLEYLETRHEQSGAPYCEQASDDAQCPTNLCDHIYSHHLPLDPWRESPSQSWCFR